MIEEEKIQLIVEKVLQKIKAEYSPPSLPSSPVIHISQTGKYGIFPDVESAINAAEKSFEKFLSIPLDIKAKIIQSMREVTLKNLVFLSQKAVEETGLGRVEDKIIKNKLTAEKTPGIEILLPKAFSGDNGLTLIERAPYGVIGSITPCTNPTETILNNAIGMIAGGNSVVFNPHPAAKKISVEFIKMLNEAIIGGGGPDNLICTVPEPTIESAQFLMKHPKIKLVVVTGGPQVVKVAMSSGKKVIAAGPGNPPVVVDETAVIEKASKDIIAGASLDNNIVCVVEKEIIAVEAIIDKLRKELIRNGAYYLRDNQISKLEKILVEDDHPNKNFIGKNVSVILKEIGVTVSEDCRIAFCDVDEKHPFVQLEMLLPVLPMVKVKNVYEAIETAVRVEHGFYHTAVMHSLNIDHLHMMARAVNTSIFVKNAPSYAGLGLGGEGWTSWTIASPTGEGLTTALNFTRERRCALKDYFRIV